MGEERVKKGEAGCFPIHQRHPTSSELMLIPPEGQTGIRSGVEEEASLREENL
ncbi:MAG: hypothetical protein NVS4B9_18800 [Ktedonobacteraceae bacterium]